MKKILLLSLMLLGCTSSPGVIPIGDDTYNIMISGQSGFVGVGGMKADAYVAAQNYCKKQNKSLKEVSFNSSSGFGKFPEVELKFKCVQ
ncbi:MAG: hypothetical protein COA54_04975 [Thiotrichaceae bacterium]|nr:MAG: hypothetical protein COA54_04975 [Thiotrichaceae bacterium]